MQKIILTSGDVALVDDGDFDLVSPHTWYRFQSGGKTNVYAKTSICGRLVAMHQLIAGANGQLVDHKDGNGLNNQRLNLRPCTATQNQWNRRVARSNKCGIKGVHQSKALVAEGLKNTFIAQARLGGKKIHIGVFPSAVAAGAAYSEFARLHHGEFANC